MYSYGSDLVRYDEPRLVLKDTGEKHGEYVDFIYEDKHGTRYIIPDYVFEELAWNTCYFSVKMMDSDEHVMVRYNNRR